MEIALTAVPEVVRSDRENHKDLVDLYNGLKMTEKIFLSTLERHGLKKVVPEVGERFDPNVHEATFQAPPTKEGMEAGTVMHVMRSGFLLHGRVLRVSCLRGPLIFFLKGRAKANEMSFTSLGPASWCR